MLTELAEILIKIRRDIDLSFNMEIFDYTARRRFYTDAVNAIDELINEERKKLDDLKENT